MYFGRDQPFNPFCGRLYNLGGAGRRKLHGIGRGHGGYRDTEVLDNVLIFERTYIYTATNNMKDLFA